VFKNLLDYSLKIINWLSANKLKDILNLPEKFFGNSILKEMATLMKSKIFKNSWLKLSESNGIKPK
jgi:hypothetical protein